MATPTYVPLATTTLASSASSVLFAGIPTQDVNGNDLRDLVLVIEWKVVSGTGGCALQLNGDATGVYSTIIMSGNGSTTSSYASSGDTRTLNISSASTTVSSINVWQIMDYTATDKHKSILVRGDRADSSTGAMANRYANTSAITSITALVPGGSFAAGSTFSIFGIAG